MAFFSELSMVTAWQSKERIFGILAIHRTLHRPRALSLVNLPEPASFGFRHGIFAMMQITFHSSSGIVFCEMGDLQDDTDGLVEVFDLHVPDLQGAR